MEAGLELLKALTDRGSGRLKNLDARLEKLDGQIREQAAYLEKVRQNGKRRKELEERKKEREQFLPVLQAAAGRLGGGEKLRGCSAGAGPDDPGMYGMERQ